MRINRIKCNMLCVGREGDFAGGQGGSASTGIFIGDVTTALGIQDVTTGFSVQSATTGLSLASCTTALSVSGTTTTGVSLAGTLTTGVTIGACTTGLAVTGATTNAIAITGISTDAMLDITTTGTIGSYGIYVKSNCTGFTGSEHKALYVRAEAVTNSAAGKSVYGAIIYGTANAVTMTTGSLWGSLTYAYVKGDAAQTINNVYAQQVEFSMDAGRSNNLTLTTEAAVILAKVTAGKMADDTKLHGIIIRLGDMDGHSATFGNGIFIEDDAAMSGTCGLTKGICLEAGATTGIALEGATTTGINITGNATDAIKIQTGTFTDAIEIAGTTTNAINISGAVTTGLLIAGATTNGISITGASSTASISIAHTLAAPDDIGIKMVTSSASTTSTSQNYIDCTHTMSGATGAVGGRASFYTVTSGSITLGGWSNALKGNFNASSAAGGTGLHSAICAEMTVPNATVSGGHYSPLEIELNIPSSHVPQTGNLSLMYFGINTTPATFDTYGTLFDLVGVTGADNKMFDDSVAAVTDPQIEAFIRCSVNGTYWYIPLCDQPDGD